jgi:hypothetical protein
VTAFPEQEWRELLLALCADDPASVGTVVAGEPLACVGPTRFDWLTAFDWRPTGPDFGIALLRLAEPGTFPPSAWDPVCGPLVAGPRLPGRGPDLQGIAEPPGTGNRAAVYLTVDRSPDDPLARVTEVRIRIEPR